MGQGGKTSCSRKKKRSFKLKIQTLGCFFFKRYNICSGFSCPIPHSSKKINHFQPTVLKLCYTGRASHSMSQWDLASELIFSERSTGSAGYFLNVHYPCTSLKKPTHQHKRRITLHHVHSKGSPAAQAEVTLPTWTCWPGPHAIRTILNTLVSKTDTAAAQMWQEKMTRNLNWQLSNKIQLRVLIGPFIF